LQWQHYSCLEVPSMAAYKHQLGLKGNTQKGCLSASAKTEGQHQLSLKTSSAS
jgi:hypothetical protein